MTLRTSDVAICAETTAFTIRELSDLGLLGPGARSENNYRQFDLKAVPLVHLWKTLRSLGLSAQELRELGRDRTPEKSRALLCHYSQKLSTEVTELQANLDMLQSYASLIEEGQAAVEGIQLRTLPAQSIRCSPLEPAGGKTRAKVAAIERQRRAFRHLRQTGGACCPLGFAYDDFYDLLERCGQPDQLVSYDPRGKDVCPAGEYLVGIEHCCGEEESTLPRRMFDYALRNDFEFTGPAFTASLFDAASVTTAEQYLFRVTAQVKRAQSPAQTQ